jgi:hypothetical protein
MRIATRSRCNAVYLDCHKVSGTRGMEEEGRRRHHRAWPNTPNRVSVERADSAFLNLKACKRVASHEFFNLIKREVLP